MCALEEPEQEFVLPGCPFNVDLPKLLAVPPRPVLAPDELFSHQSSSVRPHRPISVEGPEQEFFLPGCPIQLHPPKQLAVHPCLVSAPDELFSTVCPIPHPRPCAPLRSVCSLSSLQSQSSGSAWSVSASELMFSDTEDEESEFGETIQAFLKPERCQRQMIAWEEEEEEVLDDESWQSKVFEFEGLSKAGDSEAEHDIASMFCVNPADGAESKPSGNVLEQPKNKRKVQMNLFTWAEDKVKEKVERNLQKERERRERELLHQRYRNDPKLKHLWINKHNHNNRWC
ncbi:uncharacterized protein [Danio rerio]|uniref:Uncharacterized protein n=1 Tax=Danio rerio TaxID=7955 RepID=A0AC58JPP2_DANRE